jgi:hypothetical protein
MLYAFRFHPYFTIACTPPAAPKQVQNRVPNDGISSHSQHISAPRIAADASQIAGASGGE